MRDAEAGVVSVPDHFTQVVAEALVCYLYSDQGPQALDADPQAALAPVIAAAHDLAGLERHTGRVTPDVIT
jgi:hypothetical protein